MHRGHTALAALTLLAIVAVTFPVFASAATLSGVVSPTQQLLPLGANTCQSLQVLSVTPYVYDNSLDSFDITIADPSYVSVIGSAGGTGIPLRYMHRTMNADGTLRIHIDIDSTIVNGILPVSLTLLSAPSNKPVCVSIVSFTLTGPASPVKASPAPVTSPAKTTPAPVSTVSESTSTSSSSSSTSAPIVNGGLSGSLTRACVAAGPYQLWFILLALFMVVVGLVAFAEPPLGNRGPVVPLTAILVPLVLLLLFWYLAPACRVAGWIPVVLIIAAAIGLVTAFRDQEMPLGRVIQLPQSKQPPAPTPASAKPMMVEKTTTTKTSVLVPQTPPVKTTTKTETTIITPPPSQPKKG